jgi:heavy metal sensor kinase
MRSIRLSLIVYFLVLTTVVLGAVSALVYRTTARTLEDRQADARRLIVAQYDRRCAEEAAALDRRIARQAQTIASMAKTVTQHPEGLYPINLVLGATVPHGLRSLPMWAHKTTHQAMWEMRFRPKRNELDIDGAEHLLLAHDNGQPREYFQAYDKRGHAFKRSESLGTHYFTLEPEAVEDMELFEKRYDTVELEPGHTLRRVTVKLTAGGHQNKPLPWLWVWRVPPPPIRRGAKTRMPPPAWPTNFDFPSVFVQYASDTGPLQARLAELAHDRDRNLAELSSEIDANLRGLRARLLWIFLATFAAVVLGGAFLVRLGLAPLARLSDAVSRVSPRDFRLKLDATPLPGELQPIADRLTQTLDQLHQAFEREKQAAADISHELRTPLAALLTTVEVALRKSRSVREYQEILEECKMSGAQMSMLVERLLTLARLDAGADRCRLREADVSDVALQCADLVRPLARARGLTLRTDIEPGLILQADPDKVRELVTNLLHNAVEYNRPDGTIDLIVRHDAGRLLIEVRDTGIGIAPAALPHIFERFYRADPSRHADTPHAGLGLAIVKSYVDLMGGTIDVDSSPAGTAFRVRLPAAGFADHLLTAAGADQRQAV